MCGLLVIVAHIHDSFTNFSWKVRIGKMYDKKCYLSKYKKEVKEKDQTYLTYYCNLIGQLQTLLISN